MTRLPRPEEGSDARCEAAGAPEGYPRFLVWTWADPGHPSGSPAILAAILDPVPPARVEVVCESGFGTPQHTLRRIAHPVRRYRLHQWLWPFRRGSRVRGVLRHLCLPFLLAYGLWRIARFRPACILTIYYDHLWILTSFLLSRLTATPVVFYVHDPYEEAARHRGGFGRRLAAWLEPRSLRRGTVLVLSETAREQYEGKYGIAATVLPHIASHGPLEPPAKEPGAGRVIGYAGTIYDNNRDLMRQLAEAVESNERLRLRVWTPASREMLASCGLLQERVEVRFEDDYDRLLKALAACDLLYMPLTFRDTATLPSDSLRYAFPTKVVDYCLTGAPVLVHCPEDYAAARFFARHGAGHVLSDDGDGALRGWLDAWFGGRHEPPTRAAAERARASFDAERNSEIFRRALWRAAGNATEAAS